MLHLQACGVFAAVSAISRQAREQAISRGALECVAAALRIAKGEEACCMFVHVRLTSRVYVDPRLCGAACVALAGLTAGYTGHDSDTVIAVIPQICGALSAYPDVVSVQHHACMALSHLASGADDCGRVEIIGSGGVALCIAAVQAHTNSVDVNWCELTSHMRIVYFVQRGSKVMFLFLKVTNSLNVRFLPPLHLITV